MLKIRRIQIKNFRQYKNVTVQPPDDKGLFLFIGKNGIGKSNFLNALCWCLYEKQPFKFHDDEKSLLNEDAAKNNEYDEVRVEIEVEMDGKVYLFRRTKRETQNSQLNVMMKYKEDWNRLENPTIIVNSFLPESIRKFFLFDGEAVQTLFKGDYSSGLKDSIWKVSGVELLDRAIQQLENIIVELRRSVSRGEPQMEEYETKLKEIDILLPQKGKEKEEKEKELEKLKNNIRKLREKQAQFSKYRDLQDKRESLEKYHSQLVENLSEIEKDINSKIISLAPFIYIKEQIINVALKINEGKEKGEIPPKIRLPFVQELIDKGECICGNKISKGCKEYEKLIKLLEDVEPKENRAFLLEDTFEINGILREINSFRESINSLREKKVLIISKKDTVERELRETREKLKNAPDREVGSLESTIQRIEDQIEENIRDIGILEGEIKRNEELKHELTDRLAKLSMTQERNMLKAKKLDFSLKAKAKAEEIRSRIIDQVRRVVSLKTDKYFKSLIWKKDDFDRIEFSEDYKILVSRKGKNINSLEDLSTGELKVLGFATIKALGELSGFQKVPAFIDGPLEYLDSEVQNSFLNLLPQFMPDKQVFVFSVDRESILKFGKEEIKKCNFYNLNREKGGTETVITQSNGD